MNCMFKDARVAISAFSIAFPNSDPLCDYEYETLEMQFRAEHDVCKKLHRNSRMFNKKWQMEIVFSWNIVNKNITRRKNARFQIQPYVYSRHLFFAVVKLTEFFFVIQEED